MLPKAVFVHENVHKDGEVEFRGAVIFPSIAHVNVSVVLALVPRCNVST